MYQTIQVNVAELQNFVSLYFILCSVADMLTFRNTCVELVETKQKRSLDTYVKSNVSGRNCAVIMCCARRARVGQSWQILRVGRVCSGRVSQNLQDFSDMHATVRALEQESHA
jgi:hypothetical protein